MGFLSGLKHIGQGLGVIGSGSEDQAARGAALFDKMKTPALQKLALKNYKAAPDARTFLSSLSPTGLAGISADPQAVAAQRAALTQLGDLSLGQLTTADLANMRDIRNSQNINNQGIQGAILQNAAARGAGGAGSTLAARLSGAQGAANNVAQMGTDVAGMASNRGLQALTAMGALGSQLRSQDYNEKAGAASAQDMINQFNANAANNAGMAQWQNVQNVGNANVQNKNEAIRYNTQQLPQQNFLNQMGLNQSRAGAYNAIGAAEDTNTNRLTNFLGSAMQAGATAMSGGAKK